MSFEESLVRHASPTLAGIKVANLYNHRFASEEECTKALVCFNALMNRKGIYVELLQSKENFYLIYVYRKSHLLRLLDMPDVRSFLAEFGYPVESGLQACLSCLKVKVNGKGKFPHEVGIFLGYPLADVRAFIENEAQNCVLYGDWKAYQNEQSAASTFCKYRHCREVYWKVYSRGRKFSQMLVGA